MSLCLNMHPASNEENLSEYKYWLGLAKTFSNLIDKNTSPEEYAKKMSNYKPNTLDSDEDWLEYHKSSSIFIITHHSKGVEREVKLYAENIEDAEKAFQYWQELKDSDFLCEGDQLIQRTYGKVDEVIDGWVD